VTARSKKWLFSLVALIVALVALAAWIGTRKIVDTNDMAARQQLSAIDQALQLYKADHGQYPKSEEGLAAMVDPSHKGRGYLADRAVLIDPWGHVYVYRRTDDTYSLYSRGPNGVDDGGKGDDIVGPPAH
jgi:general secretion pathway protein G